MSEPQPSLLAPSPYTGPAIPPSDRYLSPPVKSLDRDNTKEQEAQP